MLATELRPGFLLVALVSGCVGGAPLKPIDRFHLSVYQLSGAFFTGRTTYAGFVNTYNGIAQDHKQITMHTKTRMALGLAELSGWLLMVLCTIASPSVSNHTRFKFKDLIEGLIIAPQLWGLAIAGAYDVLRASSEMNNGVTIARF